MQRRCLPEMHERDEGAVLEKVTCQDVLHGQKWQRQVIEAHVANNLHQLVQVVHRQRLNSN